MPKYHIPAASTFEHLPSSAGSRPGHAQTRALPSSVRPNLFSGD
jgi:hypothetical protein